MKYFGLVVAALAFPFLVSGCSSVESVHPLSSPRTAVHDDRLGGLWAVADNKGNVSEYLYVNFGSGGSGKLMTFGGFEDGELDRSQFDFFVTRTAKHNYLNLSRGITTVNGQTHIDHTGRYTFVEYHFSWRGQLVYSNVDGPGLVTAVQSGKLKGKVTSDSKSNSTDTLLKDSSEHILGFIESSKPQDVFGVASKFDKIGGE